MCPSVFSDRTCPNMIAGAILAKYMKTIEAIVDNKVSTLHLLVVVSHTESLKSLGY